jgi:hypothetical protein
MSQGYACGRGTWARAVVDMSQELIQAYKPNDIIAFRHLLAP